MGREFVFVQSDWDEMLLGLSRGDIDLALNGYEFTVERGSRYLASLPYYIYELALCARSADSELKSWESLREPNNDGHKKRVGVLESSSADRYVTERFGSTCEIVRWKGSTETLWLVEMGQLDATVQD